ncbi:MAG: 2TM domain-containing protein [Pseudomonadota bacterium]
MPTTDLQLDLLARRRAKAKVGWLLHATIYLVVNAGLIALSFLSGRHWALFPLLGWGFGLLMHGLSVWVFAPGSGVMERLVQRERAKLGAQRADRW